MMDTWWYNSATWMQTQVRAGVGEQTKYRRREVAPDSAGAATYGAWGEWQTIPQAHGISSFLEGLGEMQELVPPPS